MSDANEVISQTASGQLKSIIERLERLNEDRAALASDFKEVMNEAAGQGFEKKAIRAVLKFRAEDKAKRQELDAIVDLYLTSIGESV